MPTEIDRPIWCRALVLCALYLLLGYGCTLLAHASSQSAPVSLGAGLLFAYFLRSNDRPQSMAWLFAAGLLASTAWAMLAHALGLGSALLFGLIETGCAWLGAWAASYRLKSAPLSLITTSRFLLGAVITAALGASLATLLWSYTDSNTSWLLEWRTWAFSTALGVVLLVPVAQAYQGFVARRSGAMTRNQFLAGLVAFVIFAALALSVFSSGVERWGTSATTLAYLPMPFLLAASMLWGPRGGSVVMLVGGLLIVGRSAAGAGPFAVLDAFVGEAVIEAQAFVALWAVLLLFGRGLENDRHNALKTANDWRLRYERTLQASGVISAEFDPVSGAATWSPGAAQILGNHMADLQNIDDWLRHVDPANQPLAQAAWQCACEGHPVARYSYEVQLGGNHYAAEVSLAPLSGPDGSVELVAALVRVLNPQVTQG